ncbi:MAG: DUF2147 domain-containing protein [Hyphomicrobiaceae bacterium]|nr:DUF2147 domain-containing protein [Hyphomicrobiaceae bacterium]
MRTPLRSTRNTTLIVGLAASCAAVLASAASAAAASDPTGIWLDDKKRGAIEIKRCGANLCGYVVWIKDGRDAKGCGKQIMGDVARISSSEWDNGWIYSPERKATYSVALIPAGRDNLTVIGYAGTRLFSQTMTWTRAPADLVRCDSGDTVEAAVKPAAPATGKTPPPKAAKAPAEPRVARTEPAPPVPAPVPAPRVKAPTPAVTAPPAETAESADQLPGPREPDRFAANDVAESGDASVAEADRAPDDDIGAAPADEPAERPRREKTCTISAPFVTISFPCKK